MKKEKKSMKVKDKFPIPLLPNQVQIEILAALNEIKKNTAALVQSAKDQTIG